MFGTENEGFCGLMKPFFGCIAIATEVKNDEIRTRNAKFAGKRLAQDEFIVNVRGKNNCPAISQEFIHFVVPKFFTPNGDTFNDFFLLQGLKFFNTAEVSIFDRYGSLIKYSNTTSFSWDGTFNNRTLPASDYWYHIKIDEMEFRGHFALKQ